MAEEISAGKISIDFGADLSDLHQAFAGARKSLNDLGGSLTKGTGAMGDFGTATSVAGGILGADFIKGAISAAKSIASFAFTVTESASTIVEGMDIVAQQTGLTLQQMQELEPVFRRNNLSAQSMGSIFRILARNINEARDPTSQAGKSFQELGIALTGLETPSQVFALIAERISKLPDGFKKTRLETELLGRSGIQLNAVMRDGAEGLRRSAAEARAMGNVLNTDANAALLKVNDSFDDLATASGNLQKHLAVLFSPFVQAVNEASIALIHFATSTIDQVIISTRTLSVRLEALFGFLRAQAQLSITDWAQIPEIWERWNHWAVEQIDAIRQIGIVSKDTANSIGQIDQKALASATALQHANDRTSLSLTELDMGWAIVEKSLTAYRVSQQAQRDQGAAVVTQFAALDTQLRAVAEAGDKARLATGGITAADFAGLSSARAIEGIDAEIVKMRQLADFKIQAANDELTFLSTTKERKQALLVELHAIEAQTIHGIEALQAQADEAAIVGASAVATAQQRARETDLTAMATAANAEVRILEGQFATAETLRAARLTAIQANLAKELAAVGLTEAQKTAILRTAEAERITIGRQYPTFFQKQMQDLVASNAFSVSQIATTWTSGLANSIVNGGNFIKAAWQQTQVAILQGALNTGIQLAAQWALRAATEIGFAGATAASVGAINAAKYSMIIAGETATAGATVGIWAGALTAVNTMMVANGIAMKIFFTKTILPMVIASAKFIMGILLAIAKGMASTLYGIPVAVAITVAVVGIGVAIAAAMGAFAKGGIVTGPTLGLMGEAGSAEAAIPLNDRGAAFMAKTMGLSRGAAGTAPTQQTIIVELAGAPIMKMVANGLPSMLRLKGLPA